MGVLLNWYTVCHFILFWGAYGIKSTPFGLTQCRSNISTISQNKCKGCTSAAHKDDSICCEKCKKIYHWGCSHLSTYDIKLHKKKHTSPGDPVLSKNTANFVTKLFLKTLIVLTVIIVTTGITFIAQT